MPARVEEGDSDDTTTVVETATTFITVENSVFAHDADGDKTERGGSRCGSVSGRASVEGCGSDDLDRDAGI